MVMEFSVQVRYQQNQRQATQWEREHPRGFAG